MKAIRKRSAQHSALIVKSDYLHHDDWCQYLTRNYNIEIFPQIVRSNKMYHEIRTFIFPTKKEILPYDKIKKTLQDYEDLTHHAFYIPAFNNVLVSNFIVWHNTNNRTIMGLLNKTNEDVDYAFIESGLLEAKAGREQWLFSGYSDVIQNLSDKIIKYNWGFGKVIKISQLKDYKLNMFERFFRLLGANDKEAKMLSFAKYYNLLDNLTDELTQQYVSNISKTSREKMMDIIGNGIITCSWINGAIHEINKRRNIPNLNSSFSP